jgi:hypothetical protein
MWWIPSIGLPVAAAIALALLAATDKHPYIPGPRVYASASISPIASPASESARPIAPGYYRLSALQDPEDPTNSHRM